MSPRHSLNGGGPISAQAVLDGDSLSNGSRACEHTWLRNYQRVSLVAEDSVSCIVGALLRDGIAFEIHERHMSTLRVRAPAEGMRAATLNLRIPSSVFIAVSGLLEGRLLDYALFCANTYWEIALAPGIYLVKIGFGDPSYDGSSSYDGCTVGPSGGTMQPVAGSRISQRMTFSTQSVTIGAGQSLRFAGEWSVDCSTVNTITITRFTYG